MVNIGNLGELRNYSLETIEDWPNGSKFGLCLTHDVDRVKKSYQYITHGIKNKSFSDMLSFFQSGDEPYWQFENIINLEESLGVRSTFFFLNESQKVNYFSPRTWPESLGRYDISSKKIKRIIKKLDEGGWEIGLHGSINSYNNINLLNHEKKVLEEIVGHKIYASRQHWLNLEIPQTWDIHRKLGLKYDSTFGPKYSVGFKNNLYHPFRPFNDNFLVLPLVIMDSFLFDLYPKFEDAMKMVMKIIDQVSENKGLLTILWHQSTFYENDFPDYLEAYRQIIQVCSEKGAWVANCKQVFEHTTGEVLD